MVTAGWFPGRKAALDITDLEEKSYPSGSIDFLKEYGFLKIPDFSSPRPDTIEINPFMADDRVGSWAEVMEFELFPIAWHSGGHDVVVDENGCVYLLGDYCYCFGKGIYQGIENILRNQWYSSLFFSPDEKQWIDDNNNIVDFAKYTFPTWE